MEKVLMTATPPTSNGDLHVGHLSGPYLAADVYRRFCRARGKQAFYNFGGDDNQSYILLKGLQTGVTPAQVAAQFNDHITSTLKRASIELDCYVRPLSSSHHRPFIENFFRRLYEAGHLIVKETEALWCPESDRYLYEAHVRGRCPHCGESADGNICESCARPNVVMDLIDPRSKYSDQPPVRRRVRQLFFPLSRWESELEAFFGRVAMGSHLASLCETMLADGLPDIPVSHPSQWGIPVPVDGFEGQTIYAWFEMAPGYLSSTQEMLDLLERKESWEDYWKSDDAEVVQFFGFDNGYFHAILFPAAWMAYDPDIRLPSAFVTNEFYRLEGRKFSTSRGLVIWGQEALDHLPADVLRYYLCYDRPETRQEDFDLRKLDETVRRELLGSWRWLLDLGQRARKRGQGQAPAAGKLSVNQARFVDDLTRLGHEITIAYEAPTFSTQRVVGFLNELVRTARAFGDAERHWQTSERTRPRFDTALALELAAARMLAIMACPIMPDFGERLWSELGFKTPLADSPWPRAPEPLPAGQQITGLDAEYFPDVSAAVEAVAATRAAREAASLVTSS